MQIVLFDFIDDYELYGIMHACTIIMIITCNKEKNEEYTQRDWEGGGDSEWKWVVVQNQFALCSSSLSYY